MALSFELTKSYQMIIVIRAAGIITGFVDRRLVAVSTRIHLRMVVAESARNLQIIAIVEVVSFKMDWTSFAMTTARNYQIGCFAIAIEAYQHLGRTYYQSLQTVTHKMAIEPPSEYYQVPSTCRWLSVD